MVFHRGPQGLKTSSLLMAITLALASSLASASVQVLYTTDTNSNLVDRMEQGQAYVVGFATSEKPEPPAAPHRSVMMRDANGTAFRCYIPDLASGGGSRTDAPAEGGSSVGTGGQGSLTPRQKPSELLQALEGHCFYRVEEWWTYELCYRKQLRQYHKEGGRVVSQYLLGRYSGASTAASSDGEEGGSGEQGGSTDGGGGKVVAAAEAAPPAAEGSVAGKTAQPSSAAAEAFAAADAKAAAAKAAEAAAVAAAEDEVQVDPSDVAGSGRYVAQQYVGGEACELTAQPRHAEVRFTCGAGGDTLLASVKELASCSYLVTITTPRLCKHPAFQQQPEPAALIQCHPVPEAEAAAAPAGSCAAGATGNCGAGAAVSPAEGGSVGAGAADGSAAAGADNLTQQGGQAGEGEEIDDASLLQSLLEGGGAGGEGYDDEDDEDDAGARAEL